MITLMKEITNAKVFLTHRLLTFSPSHTPLRQLADFSSLIVYCSYRGIRCKKVTLYC